MIHFYEKFKGVYLIGGGTQKHQAMRSVELCKTSSTFCSLTVCGAKNNICSNLSIVSSSKTSHERSRCSRQRWYPRSWRLWWQKKGWSNSIDIFSELRMVAHQSLHPKLLLLSHIVIKTKKVFLIKLLDFRMKFYFCGRSAPVGERSAAWLIQDHLTYLLKLEHQQVFKQNQQVLI